MAGCGGQLPTGDLEIGPEVPALCRLLELAVHPARPTVVAQVMDLRRVFEGDDRLSVWVKGEVLGYCTTPNAGG